ncbi:MAG: histidinol dehydrogenase [Eubacteriales bacterium]
MIRLFERDIPLSAILNRDIQSYPEQEQTVRDIIADVRQNGDRAVLAYGRKFDCPTLASLPVTRAEMEAAKSRLDPEFLRTLRQAKENIEFFHRHQLRDGFRLEKEQGVILGQSYTPIEKVGIYVPGGTASYPSTVLMNAIPAKIAGVSQLVMTTPANQKGEVADEILAAAELCGVDLVFRCGGAQAIAALAYGTETIPAVNKIVGPGNIFVAIAKRMVFGRVAIDMIAGPSEILVIADRTANPRYVAADLLSQAEHDRLASAVLLTDSPELAAAVRDQLELQIPALQRADIARASIDQNGKIILTDSMEKAVELSNAIAPEHLELCVAQPFDLLPLVRNAGSIFLGHHTPEALGDYFAGTNHTLPTGGSAAFSSPLSVDDFRKKSSYLYYPEPALRSVSGRVADFALREGLQGHAQSVLVRLEEDS